MSGQAHTGVVDERVDRAERRTDLGDRAGGRPGLGHVGGDRVRPGARAGELAGDLGEALRVAIDDAHRSALVGEQVRGRAPHPARGARDDRDPAGDRAAQGRQARHAEPPSRRRIAPVQKLDASLAKYSAAPATSPGSPPRPSAIVARARASKASMSHAFEMSVRNGPAMMQFTRTFGPSAFAKPSVSALSPAFAAA